jgi:hypothetical protein
MNCQVCALAGVKRRAIRWYGFQTYGGKLLKAPLCGDHKKDLQQSTPVVCLSRRVTPRPEYSAFRTVLGRVRA